MRSWVKQSTRSQHERNENVGRACAVCADPMTTPHRDHDAKSGAFRGWVCQACNLTLGHSGDSPARLRACATYLEKEGGMVTTPPQ